MVAPVLRMTPLGVWRQWDGWWYIGISQRGYDWDFHGHSPTAFFPLLPSLIHALALVGLPRVLGGILVANLAFLAALLYLHALAEQAVGPVMARRAVWIYALFPMAFFTFAPYTESLFLLAAAGAFYHARKGEGTFAALWVAASVATRSTGFILVLPVALMLWNRQSSLGIGVGARMVLLLHAIVRIAAPALISLSIFSLYLRGLGYPASAIFHAQVSWHRGLTWPWTGFVQSVAWPLQHTNALWPSFCETIVSTVVTVFFLGFTLAAWRGWQWPERLYALGFWALVLCTCEWRDNYFAPFSSVDRFALALFPLAWWAASNLSERRWTQLLRLESIVLAGVTAAFLGGVWIG